MVAPTSSQCYVLAALHALAFWLLVGYLFCLVQKSEDFEPTKDADVTVSKYVGDAAARNGSRGKLQLGRIQSYLVVQVLRQKIPSCFVELQESRKLLQPNLFATSSELRLFR